jgi:hypothetical protein
LWPSEIQANLAIKFAQGLGQCNSNLTDGVRSVSDISKALSALDVALVSAFNLAGSVSDVFTGLHAHYKAENWDKVHKEAGIRQDVSGNERNGVLFDSKAFDSTVMVGEL